MFQTKKQTVNPKVLTAQNFINVDEIADSAIWSLDGQIFGFLRVVAGDNHLLSEEEIMNRAERLATAIAGGSDPFQLLVIPRTIDTASMIDSLNNRRKLTNDDAKLKLLNGEIGNLQEMAREGTKEPMIVLKCWVKATKGADQLLQKRLFELRSRLSENNVPAEIMDDASITHFCKIFADLSEHQSEYEAVSDVPLLEGKRRFISKQADINDTAVLRNLLTPMGGMFFGSNKVHIGTVVGRIFAATKYPSELPYGWAVDLVNQSDCVTAITYYPGNVAELGNALSRSIHRSSMEASAIKDVRRRKQFERQAIDADQLIDELDYKNAAVGHLSILTMPFTSDDDKLEEVCRAVRSRYARLKIKLKPLGNVQQEAFKSLAPYYAPSPIIENITKQIMPLESLMGGFPMTVNIYRDDNGSYFGRTMDGGVISLDLQLRARDRTNGNLVATGESGQGKSTALKHLVLSLYQNGVKVIIIDPEREYRDMCENLGGAWLDVGGGSAMINPLQIRPAPEDETDDEEDRPSDTPLYQANDNAMAFHLHTLEVFFSLYLPTLDDIQKALLKKELVALYADFNIDWDTDVSALEADKFPTMADLYKRLVAQKGTDDRLDDLSLLVHDMADGATAFLWNGHTNVDIDSNFIVLDTQRLAQTSDFIKRAQYFNNLSMCWDMMSRNRHEPVLLLCDETHIVLDPAIPQTAMFLRNMAKRARKYEGYLWTVFQSVSDTLFPEIRMYGQAILDNATYKLILGCDGKNLQDTVDCFRLTDQERNILLSRERGKGLAFVGRQHIHVDIDIPKYKIELMGRAGGR